MLRFNSKVFLPNDNPNFNLNTYHVKVQLFLQIDTRIYNLDLNTYHVKVQLQYFLLIASIQINLNTYHVKVQ